MNEECCFGGQNRKKQIKNKKIHMTVCARKKRRRLLKTNKR